MPGAADTENIHERFLHLREQSLPSASFLA